MRSLETLGKWAVIGGALVWIGGKLVPGMRAFSQFTGILIVGGAVLFLVGMVA